MKAIKLLFIFMLIVMALLIVYWAITPYTAPQWTGFGPYDENKSGPRAKTLWDWMELLIIPVVLAGAAIWFNKRERENELTLAKKRAEVDRQISAARNEEETLKAYFDTITELLIEKHLLQAEPRSDLRAIAEARTLTTLRILNGERKGILLRFLSRSRLITLELDKTESLIRLSGADLSGIQLDEAWLLGADLGKTDLRKANLDRAVLRGAMLFDTDLTQASMNKAVLHKANMGRAKLIKADLEGAFLQEADLTLADLSEADLTGADLSDANLLGANLKSAKVSDEQLTKAQVLQGAIMPDGSKHE